ncbi:hypothetical protein GCM10023164_06540 [Christiangramia aestuarii]
MVFYPRGAEIDNDSEENKEIKRPRSVLVGQFTHRIDRSSLENDFLLLSVGFKPGALHRLTGIPFYLLTNSFIDLESIYPRRARELNNSLSGTDCYEEMIRLLETFLLELIRNPKINKRPSDKVFELIAQNSRKYSLEYLSREACWSPRQFERKSNEYIGVSPKTFSRISRFNQSYQMTLRDLCPNWLDVSLYCGYHDYQHLVKDYKDFAGTTPRNFLNEESRSLERVLGLT